MDNIDIIKAKPDYSSDPTLMDELLRLEARLGIIIRVELEGVIMRSKAQFVEKGESCTKYFFGLEKTNGKKRAINKLIDESTGEVLLDQHKISEHAVSFYQRLYTKADRNCADVSLYLDECDINKIPDSISNSLDQPITLEEMENVIKNLKNNKSPGWDGLTAEFYRHFWDDIKHTLYQSYLESINHHCLSPSQRIGVINLIPKPKPPPELVYLKHWRPITMPNVDYKIFTHIIKNRICDALPSVISKVQSGFQSGKSTQDNIVLMCLLLSVRLF